MAYSKNVNSDICGWRQTDADILPKWRKMSAEQVTGRIARRARVSVAQVLACGSDHHTLVETTNCYLRGDVCQDLAGIRQRHQRMHAALWVYILLKGTTGRKADSRTLWCLQMRIGVCISSGTLSDAHACPHLRNVLRILPPDTQRAVYNANLTSASMVRFAWKHMRLLSGEINTEAVLHIAVHSRSRTWYVGRTQQNRQRGRQM